LSAIFGLPDLLGEEREKLFIKTKVLYPLA